MPRKRGNEKGHISYHSRQFRLRVLWMNFVLSHFSVSWAIGPLYSFVEHLEALTPTGSEPWPTVRTVIEFFQLVFFSFWNHLISSITFFCPYLYFHIFVAVEMVVTYFLLSTSEKKSHYKNANLSFISHKYSAVFNLYKNNRLLVLWPVDFATFETSLIIYPADYNDSNEHIISTWSQCAQHTDSWPHTIVVHTPPS